VALLNELDDGVCTLSLNRPERLNAIDESSAVELLNAIEAADASTQVRVIVLRGRGRAFCTGRDVKAPATPRLLEAVQSVAQALVGSAKPVVVSVHGWAVGAGVEWMLDGDIVIAGRTTRFRFPEVELGVFVTGGVTTLLPRLTGLARAKAMLMLGEEFSAEQARDWGLLWSVVDDADLKRETQRIARRLAGFDRDVLARFKRVVHQAGLAEFNASLDTESRMQNELAALRESPDRDPRGDRP
jgi:2-(1,2-epoxy-1,2-dihydrophenyl)acetyl-CoA isomerase